MTELRERTYPGVRGLRIFVQFDDKEFLRRRYLLPPATLSKTYADVRKMDTVFHVLHLDREAPFTEKNKPLLGKPRLRREWILAKCSTRAIDELVTGSAPSRRVDVMFYTRRDNCIPCSETLDVERDLLEICPGVIGLLPEERRGRSTRVVDTQIEGRKLTIAVDDNEWQDLYESYEDPPETRPHKVKLNSIIEVQLYTWSKQVLHHWSSQSPKGELEYLGTGQLNSAADRLLIQPRLGSNLCYFAGQARRVSSRKYFDPTWQADKEHRDVLLDCGLPVVFEETVDPGKPSSFIQEEGEFLMGLCHLWGSISFSGVRFRTPLICRVLAMTEMDFVPSFVMLDVEQVTSSTVPEVRVGYHSKDQEKLDGIDLSGYVPPG